MDWLRSVVHQAVALVYEWADTVPIKRLRRLLTVYTEFAQQVHDCAWVAAQNVALEVLDGDLIHQESPFSPTVPRNLQHSMPDLYGRLPLSLPWDKIEPVDPSKHYVWLLDNTAFQTGSADQEELRDIHLEEAEDSDEEDLALAGPSLSQPWQAEYVAAYFIKHSGREISDVVAALCNQLSVELGSAEEATIADRVQHMVATVLPRHTIKVCAAPSGTLALGPSSSSGISAAHLSLAAEGGSPIVNSFPTAAGASHFLPGTTTFAAPDGWAVISDIDDTIKITQTTSAFGILRSTFVDEPIPVPGMPGLYKHLIRILANPPFFYLSASPYTLYPFLLSFRNTHYPPGPIILRDASWQNLGGLITSLTQNVQEYKVARIRKIHAWFPRRKIICIGDSTQQDPESYGEIARAYPGWVRAIFIRRVQDVSEVSDPEQEWKNGDERFGKAFEGLGRRMWSVFDSPEEVEKRIADLVASEDVQHGNIAPATHED